MNDEYGNIREMGMQGIHALWSKMGQNACDLNYIGLQEIVRLRYVGDWGQLLPGMEVLFTRAERKWLAEHPSARTGTILDLSYAYGWTRKGTLVKVTGFPYQLGFIGRATPEKMRKKIIEAIRTDGVSSRQLSKLGLLKLETYSALS